VTIDSRNSSLADFTFSRSREDLHVPIRSSRPAPVPTTCGLIYPVRDSPCEPHALLTTLPLTSIASDRLHVESFTLGRYNFGRLLNDLDKPFENYLTEFEDDLNKLNKVQKSTFHLTHPRHKEWAVKWCGEMVLESGRVLYSDLREILMENSAASSRQPIPYLLPHSRPTSTRHHKYGSSVAYRILCQIHRNCAVAGLSCDIQTHQFHKGLRDDIRMKTDDILSRLHLNPTKYTDVYSAAFKAADAVYELISEEDQDEWSWMGGRDPR
jgi:hypothetical protein